MTRSSSVCTSCPSSVFPLFSAPPRLRASAPPRENHLANCDRILFGKYSGSEVKVDDQEYLIMKEDDVLAIIE